jgi:hypothetical protein
VTETPLRSCAAAQATSMQHAARPQTPPNAFALLAEAAVRQRQLLTVKTPLKRPRSHHAVVYFMIRTDDEMHRVVGESQPLLRF